MVAPDNDPSNVNQYSGYDDTTGVPTDPSNERSHRSLTVVTTDAPGQHIHNTQGDPAGDAEADPVVPPQKDVIQNNDLWVDTTPAE